MTTLRYACAILCIVVTSTIIEAAQSRVHYTEIAEHGDNHIGWLYLPSKNDSVLVTIDKTGMIFYVSPDSPNPNFALPRGLFFWQSDEPENGIQLAEKMDSPVRTRPGSKKFIFDRTSGNYVHHYNYRREFYDDSRVKMLHPTHEVKAWVHVGGAQKVAGVSKKPKVQLPHTTVEAAPYAKKRTPLMMQRSTKRKPVVGWTSLHEQAYQALVSYKFRKALGLVNKILQQGGRLNIEIPGDIEDRDMAAVAFDMEHMKDDLGVDVTELPYWHELYTTLHNAEHRGKRVTINAAPNVLSAP